MQRPQALAAFLRQTAADVQAAEAAGDAPIALEAITVEQLEPSGQATESLAALAAEFQATLAFPRVEALQRALEAGRGRLQELADASNARALLDALPAGFLRPPAPGRPAEESGSAQLDAIASELALRAADGASGTQGASPASVLASTELRLVWHSHFSRCERVRTGAFWGAVRKRLAAGGREFVAALEDPLRLEIVDYEIGSRSQCQVRGSLRLRGSNYYSIPARAACWHSMLQLRRILLRACLESLSSTVTLFTETYKQISVNGVFSQSPDVPSGF